MTHPHLHANGQDATLPVYVAQVHAPIPLDHGDGGGSWIMRNLRVSAAMFALMLGALQWVGMHVHADMQEPLRKKTEAEIRAIRRDVRTMVNYQLESQRGTRELLGILASANGLEYTISPELRRAEDKALKLRDK